MKPDEKTFWAISSGIFFLIAQDLLHEQVIDPVQLLVAVERAEQLLAVFHHGLENDETELLRGGLVGVILHRGENRHIGLAVELQCVHILQLDVVAVLVGQRDEIGAEFVLHGGNLLC